METSSTIRTVSSYLSAFHLERLAARRERPAVEGFHGAVLLVDVIGFTQITQRFSEAGARGAEQLSEILNLSFGSIIDAIDRHGGDILTFAGDAVLAVWPAQGAHLEEVVMLAVQAGLEIHDIPTHPDQPLKLRASVGAGKLNAFEVGGLDERWMLVTAGDPVDQVAEADKLCQAGEVMLSTSAWSFVSDRCKGELRRSAVALKSIEYPVEAPGTLDRPEPTIDIEPYMPEVVHRRIGAGQAEFLAEFRNLTVLFITLSDLDPRSAEALDKLHAASRVLQEELDRTQGAVYQFLSDDKGTTLLAAYGLPGMSHEDDALRGTIAAVAIREGLTGVGLRSSIGVATGRLFCGSYGNDTRRQYAIVGTTINLSARLMQACVGDGLLCDEKTRQAVGERGEFEALDPVKAKGIDAPVSVFRPTALKARRHGSSAELIGRAAERAVFTERLGCLGEGVGGVVVIEGEAGIGKSQLLRWVADAATSRGVRVAEGAGDSIETTTGYLMWRQVLDDLVGSDRGNIDALFAEDQRMQQWAPLLEDVAPLGFEPNEVTGAMSGPARAQALAEILVQIVRHAASEQPLLLAVEDGHWLDSASWATLGEVAAKVDEVLVVVSTRPIPEPVPSEYDALRGHESADVLVMETLSPDEAEALVCAKLGVDELPDAVARVLREQAEGHPLYSEELAWNLVETGALHIEDRRARLAIPESALSAMAFPQGIEGVITSRIDRLPQETQLLLKVASVIGRIFSFDVLQAIAPLETESERLEQQATQLVEADLTLPERPKPDLAWIFKHALIQDTAYNLLVFKQRHLLHRSVAEWYEETFSANLAAYYPVLAYHFTLAEVPDKTRQYLDLAGTRALRTGASAEAVSFFRRALALEGGQADTRTTLRQTRWWRSLGLAYYALGQKADARDAMLRTMALSGYPMATSTFGLLLQLPWQYVLQAIYLISPKALLGKTEDEREIASLAADAAQSVSTTYYFDKENLPFFVAGVMCAAHCARAGASRESASGLSYVGVLAGLFQIDRLTEAYFRRSLEAANEVGDPWAVARHWENKAHQRAGVGIWLDEELDDAIRFFELTGDRHDLEISTTMKALITSYRGRYAESKSLYQRVLASAKGHSVQHTIWGTYKPGELMLFEAGRHDEALPLMEETLELLKLEPEEPTEIALMLDIGTIQHRKGDPRASDTVHDAMQRLKDAPPNIHGMLPAFTFGCGVQLDIWEEALAAGGDVAKARDRAYFANKQMAIFAFLFPMARARKWIMQARAALLDGKTDKARKLLEKARARGEEHDMPLDVGLANQYLGLCEPGGSEARENLLRDAGAVFASIGASQYEGRCEEG
ncbi:MAG TPA: AAA family ATPase [Myxococcota bacterium]|nr:AAA family ATPase [Myxococcota bacterium]